MLFKNWKKKEIPAIIIEADSETTESDIALIENLIRDNLTPIEEAKAYMNRWKLIGHEITVNLQYKNVAYELSKVLPRGTRAILNKLSLLKLPKTIQNAIHLGKFKKTYGYEISRLSLSKEMMTIYKKIKANKKKWNVVKIKEYIDEILEMRDTETAQKKNPFSLLILFIGDGFTGMPI